MEDILFPEQVLSKGLIELVPKIYYGFATRVKYRKKKHSSNCYFRRADGLILLLAGSARFYMGVTVI